MNFIVKDVMYIMYINAVGVHMVIHGRRGWTCEVHLPSRNYPYSVVSVTTPIIIMTIFMYVVTFSDRNVSSVLGPVIAPSTADTVEVFKSTDADAGAKTDI